jgi:hypothetical protein
MTQAIKTGSKSDPCNKGILELKDKPQSAATNLGTAFPGIRRFEEICSSEQPGLFQIPI